MRSRPSRPLAVAVSAVVTVLALLLIPGCHRAHVSVSAPTNSATANTIDCATAVQAEAQLHPGQEVQAGQVFPALGTWPASMWGSDRYSVRYFANLPTRAPDGEVPTATTPGSKRSAMAFGPPVVYPGLKPGMIGQDNSRQYPGLYLEMFRRLCQDPLLAATFYTMVDPTTDPNAPLTWGQWARELTALGAIMAETHLQLDYGSVPPGELTLRMEPGRQPRERPHVSAAPADGHPRWILWMTKAGATGPSWEMTLDCGMQFVFAPGTLPPSIPLAVN